MSLNNLNLEEVTLDDTINSTMLEKLNRNMKKIDEKYGELKNGLLVQTGKETLEEAIAYVNTISQELKYIKGLGNATTNDILPNKTALVQGQLISGTLEAIAKKVKNIALSGTYATSTYYKSVSAFYAANGDVGIVIKSNKNTSYENMYFTLSSAPSGVTLDGISPYYYSSASSYGDTYIAVLKGITTNVNISISMASANSSGDYIQCAITVTEV